MKVKYDKKLNKYHIQFNKSQEKEEKTQIYKNLSKQYDLILTFDTEIDGKPEEEREENIESLKSMLRSVDASFEITNREVEKVKRFFGIPTMGKTKTMHYIINSTIPKDKLTNELINFLIEHEVKITFENEEFYDSAIFAKMFSTIDLSQL